MDNLYEIDLEQFCINKHAFYEKIVEIISRNYGWVNFKKAVFDSEVERDYALFELEQEFGVAGKEIKEFQNDAKVLYETFRELIFPDKELSVKEQKKLKDLLLEIILLDESEIYYLVGISTTSILKKQRRETFKELENISKLKNPYIKQKLKKVYKIDNKINKIFLKKV